MYDKCLSDSHSPICITIRIKDQFKLSSPETKDNTIKGKSSNINTIKYKCKCEKECESDYVNAFDYDRVNSINDNITNYTESESTIIQSIVNALNTDICELFYESGKKLRICIEQNKNIVATRKQRRYQSNKWFTDDCEIMRHEYMDLKNKIKAETLCEALDILLLEINSKFHDYKRLINKAKINYETEFHNKLGSLKSKNIKIYWDLINDHSIHESHQTEITLGEFKLFFEELNQDIHVSQNSEKTNCDFINSSHVNEKEEINIQFTIEEV